MFTYMNKYINIIVHMDDFSTLIWITEYMLVNDMVC
jgi:hypothetical protein